MQFSVPVQVNSATPAPAGLNLLPVSATGTNATNAMIGGSSGATTTLVATPDGKTATVLNAASPAGTQLANIQLVNASGGTQTWPTILPLTYLPSNAAAGGGAIISPQLIATNSSIAGAAAVVGTGGGARMPIFTTPNTIMTGLNTAAVAAGSPARLATGNLAHFIAINPGVSALGGTGQAAAIPMIIQLPAATTTQTESS